MHIPLKVNLYVPYTSNIFIKPNLLFSLFNNTFSCSRCKASTNKNITKSSIQKYV